MERPGFTLLSFLFANRGHGVGSLNDPFGLGHIGHTPGFSDGTGASRYHRVTGRHRQRRANRRATRKVVR